MPTHPTFGHLASEALLRVTVGAVATKGWRVRVLNPEALPVKGPCFLYGNHSHNLDPFMLGMMMRWGHCPAGVLTQEYLRKGLAARALAGIGLLGTRKRVAEPHLIRKIYKLLDQGRMLIIYPEGGRRWDGRPAPWIESTAKLFARTGVPVYPVLSHGSYVGWPRWARYPRPARIRLEVLPPLTFERRAPVEETLSRLRPLIDLDENVVPDLIKPKWAYRPADGIHRLLYRDPDTGRREALFSPDGTLVINRVGTLRYRMLPDSTLLDEQTGALHLTGDLYAQIRALPLEPDPKGRLLHNDVELHLETQFPTLTPYGPVTATLFEDAVFLQGTGFSERLRLDSILFTGIERNYKLQLFQKDRMLQLSFTRSGSALQWDNAFQQLLPAGIASSSQSSTV